MAALDLRMRPMPTAAAEKDDLQRVGRSQAAASVALEEAPAMNAVKTTAQKIEEFYGVKQIGQEILFAAHFDNAQQVMIAGDFNNWTPSATPMQSIKPGEWRTRVRISAGRYRYRLVVDDKWVTDPNNQYVEANQFGELNNVVEVD